MLNKDLKLNEEMFNAECDLKSTRDAFGEELLLQGEKNPDIFALCADLTESTRTHLFAHSFPNRYIQTGIAEQNMLGIASGLALSGKIAFAVSHAAFVPAQSWNQVRQSVCMNNANVKIIATHAGFSNGRDGATAEPLEDIAIARVLPNLTVLNPADYYQTKKCIAAAVKFKGPVYIRLYKDPTPVIYSNDSPFELGRAQVLVHGTDATLVCTGPLVYEALDAARQLKAKHRINLEVVEVHSIKPLDEKTIEDSARKTGCVVTLEEAQVSGGLGSAVCEMLSAKLPTKVIRLGMKNAFGESGSYKELKDKYGLSAHHLVEVILSQCHK